MRKALLVKEYATGKLKPLGIVEGERYEDIIEKSRRLASNRNKGRLHMVELDKNDEIYSISTFDNGINPNAFNAAAEAEVLFKWDIDRINEICELGKKILIENHSMEEIGEKRGGK